MADRNQETSKGWERVENDELDRELNAALAEYAAVEPRAGLQERVLATVRAQQSQTAHRAWWQWGLASAVAAIIVVAVVLVWRAGAPTHPHLANHPSATPQTPRSLEAQAADRRGNLDSHTERAAAPRTRHRSRPETAVAANPKLDHFPSPQPLSEQEKMLANYVAQYHQQALFVAQARAELLKQDLEEETQETQQEDEHDSRAR